jgi:hypothetical protein
MHWWDRLPPLLLVVVALALIGTAVTIDQHIVPLVGMAGVFTGAAIVLEAIRGR